MNPRSSPTFALIAAWVALSTPTAAQDIEPTPVPADCPNLILAYVDPITGTDIGTSQLDDPSQPFRTIQAAIDYCQLGVILAYDATTNPSGRGLVVCMPGVYGPTGIQAGPKDTQAIKIRDRVSLQGSGARRTILRGGGFFPSTAFWPTHNACSSIQTPHEVLLELSQQSNKVGNPIAGQLPWVLGNDSEEMVDGFGFEGGEVQIHFGGENPGRGRVSNCLFDMRALPSGSPLFGILVVHVYTATEPPYWDAPLVILNNTFVMGEMPPSDSSEPAALANNNAVAICDVTNSCTDPYDQTLRGIGKLSIQNNLIRSLQSQAGLVELLGIDDGDTSVPFGGGTNWGSTNSFRASRAASSNALFTSMVLGAAAVPRPSADIDVLANDPPFVGEALAPTLPSFHHYRDWRLLPESSLAMNAQQDAGCSPLDDFTLTATNGVAYVEPACPLLRSFDWDGEAYGNPRIVDGEVDIGFDEIHGLIMAGCWANNTNNHNLPDAGIDPNGGTGASFRVMIFPEKFQGGSVSVNGTLVPYVNAPPITAWLSQPGTLSPPVTNGSLPLDYRDRYIVFTNPAPTPTPWTGTIAARVLTNPVSLQPFRVGLITRTDTEGSLVQCNYFNAQALVTKMSVKYRTNLQSEYR